MEFFKNIYEKYLSVNLSDYKNIGIDLDINVLVLGITVAFIVISILMYRRQTVISTLFKKLIRTEAFGENKAVTLAELGLCEKKYRRLVLNREGNLKSCLSVIGEKRQTCEDYLNGENNKKATAKTAEENTSEEESDNRELSAERMKSESPAVNNITDGKRLLSLDARFYVPEEKRDLAHRILESNTTTVTKTVISCSVLLVFGIALIFAMPSILSFINSALAK